MNFRLLVADDEKNIRETLALILESEGYRVEEADSGAQTLERAAADPPDALLLDLQLGDMDGLEVLQRLRERDRRFPIVVISGHGTLADAVEAMKRGAYDYIEKPPTKERLLLTLRNLFERQALQAENRALHEELGRHFAMIGQAPLMRRLFEEIGKVAPTRGRVLITGESGTGKELIARAIHEASPRRDRPFLKINCAAIPTELLESELFGHVRGAFTGAVKDKPGQFALADGGTLFLDEVGDMDMASQAKVLRALQTGEITPIGGDRSRTVDVRVIAATNKDLRQAVAAGRFREDLYYRLNVIPLHAPPLRDRKEDIPALVERFLALCCEENGFRSRRIAPEAMARLAAYDWPGNVRELRNLIERMVIMGGEVIAPADLPPPLSGVSRPAAPASAGDGAPGYADGLTLRDLREQVERDYIARALEAHRGNVSRTADALGIERTNLHKKIKQYGLRHQPEDA